MFCSSTDVYELTEYVHFVFTKYFKSCQYSVKSAKMVFVQTWLVYFSFQDDFTI